MKYIFIVCLLFTGCIKPRIDLDLRQFGDHAYMSRVEIFRLDTTEEQLQEYHETGELTPSVKEVFVDRGTVIDSSAATAVCTVAPNTDLTNVGIAFISTAQKIEPLGGAPVPGHLSDFSKGGPYVYRLTSADGTKRDWTVTIKF